MNKLTELKNQLVLVNYQNKNNNTNEQSGQIIEVDTNKIVLQIDDNGCVNIARGKINYISDASLSIVWRREVVQS